MTQLPNWLIRRLNGEEKAPNYNREIVKVDGMKYAGKRIAVDTPQADSPVQWRYETVCREKPLEGVSGVTILPFTDDNLVLTSIFRFGMNEPGKTSRFSLEIPGGAVDSDETPEQAALRELLKETGYTSAEEPKHLVSSFQNGAESNSDNHTYVLRGCFWGQEPDLDPVERALGLKVLVLSLEQLDLIYQRCSEVVDPAIGNALWALHRQSMQA